VCYMFTVLVSFFETDLQLFGWQSKVKGKGTQVSE